MKLEITDCTYLQLDGWELYKDRYLAALYPGLGVCVYTVGSSELWHYRLFPIKGDTSTELHMSYVTYVSKVAMSYGEDEKLFRRLYPFSTAPDLLTLKAQITDAAERWKEHQQHEHL